MNGGAINDGIINASGAFNGNIVNQGVGDFNVTGNLTGNGTFTNNGTATLDVNSGTFSGVTTLTNNSTAAAGVNIAGGAAVSANAVVNNAGATLINSGLLTSTVGTSNAGTLTNNLGGAINGGLTNTGTATNLAGGTLDTLTNNAGTTTNTGLVTGTTTIGGGTVINNAAGVLTGLVTVNGGTLDNNAGAFANGGVTIAAAGTATNAGTINLGAVNAGNFTNENLGVVNGGLTNTGTATNLTGGTLDTLTNNAGTTTNTGLVAGTTTIGGGTVINNAAGVLTGLTTVNAGLLDNNAGAFANGGVAIAAAGTATNAGTINLGVVNAGNFTNENLGAVNGGLTNTGTATNLTGGTLDTLTNNAGTTTNTGLVAGTTTIGGGTVINNAAGVLTGLVTVNNGTLTSTGTLSNGLTNSAIANIAGTLNGPVSNLAAGTFNLTGATTGNGAFSNAGAFNANGTSITGLTSFTNAGTMTMAGATTIGATTFNNAGTMTQTNGIVGDVVTVNGNVVNTGATYGFDTAIDNPAGQADRLVVNGDFTGTFNVAFAETGGVATLATPGDTLVIDVNGATSTAAVGSVTGLTTGIFVLNDFRQIGNDWFVHTALNLAPLGGVVGSIATSQNLVNSAVNSPTRALVANQTAEPDSCAPGTYTRIIGGGARASATTSSAGSTSAPSEVVTLYTGAQLGIDYGCFDIGESGANINIGAVGGFNLGSTSQNQLLPMIGQLQSAHTFQSQYAGLYATYSKGKFAAELQGVYDTSRFNLNSMVAGTPFVADNAFDTRRFTISGSVSYAHALTDAISLIPTAGFSYSRTTADDIAVIDPASLGTLRFDPMTNIVGFAGATIAKVVAQPSETSAVQAFATAKVFNDFGGPTIVTYLPAGGGGPTQTATTNLGLYGEVSAGLTYFKVLEGANGQPRELTANIRADASFSDRLLGGRLTAQLRLQF
ncbi:MAG: hypothetical protein IPL47_03645 [Phyllobacteriaceae bacterium]|nr:hypothetical protein [Phyllobacteriaceae bacterium]